MRPDHRFLLICSAITGTAMVALALSAPPILRTFIALPLVFVLPGVGTLRALDLRFTPCAHAPIVVGISMAITVLSGLVLNWIGGLTPLGWMAWLGGVSILTAAAAIQNEYAGAAWPRPTLRVRHGVMLAAAGAILVLTVQGTLRSTAAYRPFHYTNFWMLPLAEASNVYVIGIKNGEGRPETYAVQLMVDRRITGEWQDLVLAPGQSVTYPVMVRAGAPAQAWLYRTEQPDAIYRRVTIAGNDDADATSTTATAGEVP